MKLTDILNEAPKKNKSWLAPNLKPWMFQTKDEIEKWLKDSHIEGLVSKELEIHPTRGELQLGNLFGAGPKEALVEYKGKWLLPVQFKLSGNLQSNYLEFETMEGLPFVVLGTMRLRGCAIEDFKGCPKHIQGSSNSTETDIEIDSIKPIKNFIGCPPVESLDIASTVLSIEGIPNTLTYLGLSTFCDIDAIKQACPKLELLMLTDVEPGQNGFKPLSIFKLKRLKKFFMSNNTAVKQPDDWKEALKIINHCLAQNKSALECQEELMDAGLKKFAK